MVRVFVSIDFGDLHDRFDAACKRHHSRSAPSAYVWSRYPAIVISHFHHVRTSLCEYTRDGRVIGFAEKCPFSRRDLRSSLSPLGWVEFRPANQSGRASRRRGTACSPWTSSARHIHFRAPPDTLTFPVSSLRCCNLPLASSSSPEDDFWLADWGGLRAFIFEREGPNDIIARLISSSSSLTFLCFALNSGSDTPRVAQFRGTAAGGLPHPATGTQRPSRPPRLTCFESVSTPSLFWSCRLRNLVTQFPAIFPLCVILSSPTSTSHTRSINARCASTNRPFHGQRYVTSSPNLLVPQTSTSTTTIIHRNCDHDGIVLLSPPSHFRLGQHPCLLLLTSFKTLPKNLHRRRLNNHYPV